ncbi:uncharacterized protein PGTG_21874 [Puccinia graminis f. sp. tritici CRL 75-36-700-3]|uniref:Vacuole protein n=1 Tax=Puccinia graminis f. sp. tritici (strain CRL 75-36-700-3 / race SCCL) TaxID=418459 RepID=H6QSU2_PUCGT|nr:uncharacterized protein PGTG_21874 [Puccinia graminis f. sp. tritici CRL 75-36-700-3]EHS63835.1 hypothetical protein PGTG_21874 [Puccinia graminis f. sp. tritici CRL 75-36-700-3]
MCCSGPQWKREEVPDHKWDFVDVREFHTSGLMSYFQYSFLYVLVIKSVLVYASDIYTMVLLLASNHWAGSILESSAGRSAMNVPFKVGKWIFFGCIIFSFLLLFWEAKKSRAIIKSRDISYAFTNVMANNYYSMKSYDHFCFFSQINNSKKKKDDFAFFVFFTFKGWKRLLLADAPRQVINGITLYSFARSVNFTTDISKWYEGSFAKASVLLSMAFTVTIWVGSFLLLVAAALLYVPLLCYIQGNLKEYCCHKVDKRIAELMKRKHRKRLAKEAALMRKEAMGDYSHLKDKKGQFKAAPLPQPTLPQIGLHELISDTKSERTGTANSIRTVSRAAQHPYPSSLNHHYPASNPGGGLGMAYNVVNRWPSEQEYSEKVGYAESIASTGRFVAHQAPTAGSVYGHNGQIHGARTHPYGLHPLAHQLPSDTHSSLNHAPSYSSEEQQYYTNDRHAVTRRSIAITSDYGGYGSEYGGYAHEPPLPTGQYHSEAPYTEFDFGSLPNHLESAYNPPIQHEHRFDYPEEGPPLVDREIMELYGTGALERFDQASEAATSIPPGRYPQHTNHPYSRS